MQGSWRFTLGRADCLYGMRCRQQHWTRLRATSAGDSDCRTCAPLLTLTACYPQHGAIPRALAAVLKELQRRSRTSVAVEIFDWLISLPPSHSYAALLDVYTYTTVIVSGMQRGLDMLLIVLIALRHSITAAAAAAAAAAACSRLSLGLGLADCEWDAAAQPGLRFPTSRPVVVAPCL